ncbi:MAG: DNA-processing protein DprA [Bacteroidales bacterium]|nr:DNA-processing protein DprA [Bacteroidales bacterium]
MENFSDERVCLCALNRIFGFEPKIGRMLVEAFGGAAEVFRQTGKEISDALGAYSRTKYASAITVSACESAAMELERLHGEGCSFIGLGEPGYPALLLECEDPPLGLYFKGTSLPEYVFDQRPQIAIVGTRSMSYYGRDWCRLMVEAMSKARIKALIVSGLAIGIDSAAHNAALDFGLPTVAVMATGIDMIYPPRNGRLGERIASTEGCALITDYPPGTEAVRINFLRRNRIIAGICRATILVESKIKGGGMMTARLAGSYDRDVFALPGRVDDPLSQGCNLLIKENLASPVGDLSDLVSRLGLGDTQIRRKEDFRAAVTEQYSEMPDEEREDLLKAAMKIKGRRGIAVDELCAALGWSYSKVSRIVTTLECDGFISVDLLQHCSPRLDK